MPDRLTESQVKNVVIPPDGGWGWFVVVVAFFWNLVVDGTAYTFAVFMADMLNDFNVTQSLLMTASSVQMGVYYLLGPLVAAMINRLGFRIVAMAGGLLAFVGVLSSAYAHHVYLFIATFGCVMGVAFSMTYMCNILVVGFYFDKYRAVATCIAVSGSPVGLSLFPFIFSVLLPDVNWRENYKYISGTHLLMSLFALVYKPVPSSAVVVEDKGGETETSSIWDEWEREHPIRGLADYPTNAEALQNTNYIVVTPYDIQDHESSKTSQRSNRTLKLLSTGTIPFSASEIPKWSYKKVCCCHCKCKYLMCACLWHDNRPMYRDDILYHGSTRSLQQYNRAELDVTKAKTGYNMIVTRTSHVADIPQNADCCNCCPDSVVRVLTTMLDFSLVRSFAFFLLCFSGFLTYLGAYVPCMHGIEFSIQNHVEKTRASYVLTAIGVSNWLGRIVSGVFTTVFPKVSAMVISEITMVFAGAACIAHAFFSSFTAHLTCACIFGFNIATISSLRTLVVVDLLGLEKLTNAFGLIVLMEGLASLISMPLNAFLYETYNDLRISFIFSGAMIVLSGIILIPVKALNKWEKKHALKREEQKQRKKYEEAQRIATKASTSKGR